MSNKLFVGGLSWNTSSEGLREVFEGFGEVTEAKVVTDRETGRSRGFGFVTFVSADNADAAIKGLDGKEVDGKTIKVNVAQDKPRESSGGGGRRNSFGSQDRGNFNRNRW